jgi:hypothetical protein
LKEKNDSFNENAFFEKIRFFYIFFEFKELKMSPTIKKKKKQLHPNEVKSERLSIKSVR